MRVALSIPAFSVKAKFAVAGGAVLVMVGRHLFSSEPFHSVAGRHVPHLAAVPGGA